MTATEGSHKPEATIRIDLLGSHHQFPKVTMKIDLDIHTDQIHILTIIITKINKDMKEGHLINPGMVIKTDITHITPQNTKVNIAKLTITTTTVTTLNTLHIICQC